MFRHSYTIQIIGSELGEYHVIMFDSPNEVPTNKEYQLHLKESLDCYKEEYPHNIDLVMKGKYHFVTHVYFLIVE